MKRAKLIYAGILVILSIFYVLYVDNFAFMLLLCALLLPLLLLLSLLWLKLTASAELYCNVRTNQENTNIPVKLMTKNGCPLPFPRAEAIISIRHSLGNRPQNIRLCFPLQPGNSTYMTFYLRGEYCGEITARLEKLYVRDVLHLFKVPLRCRFRTVSVIILPECLELPIQLDAPPIEMPESTEYDSIPGDDPSEILEIREYRPGDAASRIHWKLSSKYDDLFLKEFSRPISKEILLCLDYAGSAKNTAEMMKNAKGWLTMVYSVSRGLLKQNQIHRIIWCGRSETFIAEIHSVDDLTNCFCRIYHEISGMQMEAESLMQILMQEKFSSITCITNRFSQALAEILDMKAGSQQKNLILVTSAKNECFWMNNTEIFQVSPEDIQNGIHRLIL